METKSNLNLILNPFQASMQHMFVMVSFSLPYREPDWATIKVDVYSDVIAWVTSPGEVGDSHL
jgi:hypothetical protein